MFTLTEMGLILLKGMIVSLIMAHFIDHGDEYAQSFRENGWDTKFEAVGAFLFLGGVLGFTVEYADEMLLEWVYKIEAGLSGPDILPPEMAAFGLSIFVGWIAVHVAISDWDWKSPGTGGVRLWIIGAALIIL